MDPISTELLYQLIDNMPTMAYYCDVLGDCKFVNEAYTKFTGFRAADVGNFRWKGLKLVHPDDVHIIVESWKNSIGNMEPYTAEYRLMHISGEYRWVKSRAFYVKDKEGHAYAWFGTIEDINEYRIRLQHVVSNLEDTFEQVRQDLKDNIDAYDRAYEQISQPDSETQA